MVIILTALKLSRSYYSKENMKHAKPIQSTSDGSSLSSSKPYLFQDGIDGKTIHKKGSTEYIFNQKLKH